MAKMMSSPGKASGSPMGTKADAGKGGKSKRVGGIRTPFTSSIVKGGKLGGGRR